MEKTNLTFIEMIKNMELNDLLISGCFYPGISTGLTKFEIEKIIGKNFGNADIETPDLCCYYFKFKTGLTISILFDKEDICFKINLDVAENKDWKMGIQLGKKFEMINENTSFEKLISIISRLNIEWEFDSKMVYMQTVCIRLKNGLRILYAFGNKKENDFGLFSINTVLDSHKFF